MDREQDATRILSAFSGLVLVHCNYDIGYNPNYLQNLQVFVSAGRRLHKPVFLVGYVDKKIDLRRLFFEDSSPRRELEGVFSVPTGMDDIDSYQIGADIIASVLKANPDSVRLAFGGVYRDACVYNHGKSWCWEFVTKYRGIRTPPPVKNSFSYGEVLEDIV